MLHELSSIYPSMLSMELTEVEAGHWLKPSKKNNMIGYRDALWGWRSVFGSMSGFNHAGEKGKESGLPR